MSNTAYGLLDRMHHAASHCDTLYDAEWEAQQLRDAAAEIERQAAEIARLTEERDAFRASSEIRGANGEAMRTALVEIRDRIKAHPAYADLTEAEEMEVGGDTAELSYLARVADAAIGA